MTSSLLISVIFLFIWVVALWRYSKSHSAGTPKVRRGSLYLGVTVWLACVSYPLADAAANHIYIHAVNQLLLTMVATPLMVLGIPHLDFARYRIANALFHPIVSWATFVLVLIAFYTPPVVDWSYENPLSARIIQAFLLPAISLIYFWPILNPAASKFSYALRIMSLFFMMVPETMIGFFIYIQNHIIYPKILHGPNVESLLSNQQLAGALMWSMSMIVDSLWIAVAVQKWFESEKLKGEKINAEIFAERNASSA